MWNRLLSSFWTVLMMGCINAVFCETTSPPVIIDTQNNGRINPESLEVMGTTTESDLFLDSASDTTDNIFDFIIVSRGGIEGLTEKSKQTSQNVNTLNENLNKTSKISLDNQIQSPVEVVTVINVEETVDGRTLVRKPTKEELSSLDKIISSAPERSNLTDGAYEATSVRTSFKSSDLDDLSSFPKTDAVSYDENDFFGEWDDDNSDLKEMEIIMKDDEVDENDYKKVLITESKKYSNFEEVNITINQTDGDFFDNSFPLSQNMKKTLDVNDRRLPEKEVSSSAFDKIRAMLDAERTSIITEVDDEKFGNLSTTDKETTSFEDSTHWDDSIIIVSSSPSMTVTNINIVERQPEVEESTNQNIERETSSFFVNELNTELFNNTATEFTTASTADDIIVAEPVSDMTKNSENTTDSFFVTVVNISTLTPMQNEIIDEKTELFKGGDEEIVYEDNGVSVKEFNELVNFVDNSYIDVNIDPSRPVPGDTLVMEELGSGEPDSKLSAEELSSIRNTFEVDTHNEKTTPVPIDIPFSSTVETSTSKTRFFITESAIRASDVKDSVTDMNDFLQINSTDEYFSEHGGSDATTKTISLPQTSSTLNPESIAEKAGRSYTPEISVVTENPDITSDVTTNKAKQEISNASTEPTSSSSPSPTLDQSTESTSLITSDVDLSKKTMVDHTEKSSFAPTLSQSDINNNYVDKFDDLSPSAVESILNSALESYESDEDEDIGNSIRDKENGWTVMSVPDKDSSATDDEVNSDKIDSDMSSFDFFNSMESTDERTEMIPTLKLRILNNSADFNVRINRKGDSFFIPSTAFIKEYNDMVNITWRTDRSHNGSLAVKIAKNDQYYLIKKIVLTTFNGDTLHVQQKTVALCPDEVLDDTMMGRTRTVTLKDGTQITFSNVEFLKKSEIDSIEGNKNLGKVQVAGICVATIITVTVIIYMIFLRTKNVRIAILNKDQLPQMTHC